MTHRIVTVQFIIQDEELAASREQYHAQYGNETVSDEAVFADDLQAHAFDGEGHMHGSFKVLDVSKPVKGDF